MSQPSDERDYWGEYWSAVRYTQRLGIAREMICFGSTPSEDECKAFLAAIEALDALRQIVGRREMQAMASLKGHLQQP